MRKFTVGLILVIIAVVLFIVLLPLGLFVAIADSLTSRSIYPLSRVLLMTAVGIDVAGNGWCASLFNAILIRPWSKHKFGVHIETISSVLGKNKLEGTLTILGKDIDAILDFFDPNHSIKSIKYF